MSAARTSIALLMLLASVRAAHELFDEGICDAENVQPKMSGNTSIQNNNDYIIVPYGENLTVYCSSTIATNLTIQDDLNCLPTEQLNATTIQLDINLPNIGAYRYTCTDNNTCEGYFSVTVTTKITVTSPGIRHAKDALGDAVFFIPPGEVYEVTCSGNDVKLLHLQSDTGKLQTDAVNNTTLKYQSHADRLNERYQCVGRDSKINVITWTNTAAVVVDYYPEAKQFQCTLFQMRTLECSWESTSKGNTFRLFYSKPENKLYSYLDIKGTPFLCAYSLGGMTGSCTWNNNYRGRPLIGLKENFSLILQTCNDVFCNNQTFPIYSDSIVKFDPASKLELLSVTSREAIVTWRSPMVGVKFWEYEHKAQYRLLAMDWQQVNMTEHQCNREACALRLALPCPGAHYELRVSGRLLEATDSRFWSNPSSMFFFTKPSNPGDVIDPVCNTDIEEPKPLPSAENVLYEVRKLVKHERQQSMALKKKIDALKIKVAIVKELMAYPSLNSPVAKFLD